MPSVRLLPEFSNWLDNIQDTRVRDAVVARIKRLQHGLLGDIEPIGESVSEIRIHLGAGWRIYITQRSGEVVVLLAGGSKRTQKRDIIRAKKLAALLE
ncbi:type II toxin-antitoxin system RelE/ParE family toxin [Massilia sp. TWR1-2-2]|uniref:type II toxin-antitoxin system RelE/ParE family toxin n=1 Tax=Massilia sp. TWR1-2-2 TaxID=2804584 RepID=UPI003CF13DA1